MSKLLHISDDLAARLELWRAREQLSSLDAAAEALLAKAVAGENEEGLDAEALSELRALIADGEAGAGALDWDGAPPVAVAHGGRA